MYAFYNALYTATLRSNKRPQIRTAAANVCHHIGFYWTSSFQSPCCQNDSQVWGFFSLEDLMFFLSKLIKKDFLAVGIWKLASVYQNIRHMKSPFTGALQALHQLCTVLSSHLSISLGRRLLYSYQSDAPRIYISLCLLVCETRAYKHHYYSYPWLISQHCQMIEVNWQHPPPTPPNGGWAVLCGQQVQRSNYEKRTAIKPGHNSSEPTLWLRSLYLVNWWEAALLCEPLSVWEGLYLDWQPGFRGWELQKESFWDFWGRDEASLKTYLDSDVPSLV